MSRVHDALRKAQDNPDRPKPTNAVSAPIRSAIADLAEPRVVSLNQLLAGVEVVPYTPHPEALLVSMQKPREAPGEEFRTLRTRLNHLQTMQPLRTLVVTSASPAEGKSFTAVNLALTQAQLTDKKVILADFDFRRPSVDKTLQLQPSPGLTDYLRGEIPLDKAIRKLDHPNLYVMTAGQPVPNPLELLNLRECRALLDDLRENFDWVIIDSPPLLFAADGNLLATMSDGTILVVRIGSTTFETVSRALTSLCENNVLGIVVNGARRGELYSKYSYYHDYYGPDPAESTDKPALT
jgi:protein-tyrosine kinase